MGTSPGAFSTLLLAGWRDLACIQTLRHDLNGMCVSLWLWISSMLGISGVRMTRLSAFMTLDIPRQNEGGASVGTASGAPSEELAAGCELELGKAPTAGDALADVNDVGIDAPALVAEVALCRPWSVTGAIMISLGTATLAWRSTGAVGCHSSGGATFSS